MSLTQRFLIAFGACLIAAITTWLLIALVLSSCEDQRKQRRAANSEQAIEKSLNRSTK